MVHSPKTIWIFLIGAALIVAVLSGLSFRSSAQTSEAHRDQPEDERQGKERNLHDQRQIQFTIIGSLEGIKYAHNRIGGWERIVLIDNAWDLDRFRRLIPELPSIDPADRMLVVVVSWESRPRSLKQVVSDGTTMTIQIEERYIPRRDRRDIPKFVVADAPCWGGPIRVEVNGQHHHTLWKGEKLAVESQKAWAEIVRLYRGGTPAVQHRVRHWQKRWPPDMTREQIMALLEENPERYAICKDQLLRIPFSDLGAMRATPVLKDLCELIDEMADHDPARRPAFEALVAIGGPSVMECCEHAMNSPNVRTRLVACRLLKTFGDPETRPLVHTLLHDEDTWVCQGALRALRELGVGADDVPALVDLLVFGLEVCEEPDLRDPRAIHCQEMLKSAMYMLGELDAEAIEAISVLQELTRHRSRPIREGAENALERIQYAAYRELP